MKSLSYSWVSSLCALFVGLLLVVYPGAAAAYLVVVIGALFLLPGLIGTFSYFKALLPKDNVVAFGLVSLVVSLGSLFFGLWLIIMPLFFIGILMYVLGVLLVLCGLNQLVGFVSARSYMPVPVYAYVISVLVLISGIVVLANPFEAAEVPFMVLGVSFMVYALAEIFRLLRFRSKQKDEPTDVEVIEEEKTPDDGTSPH